VENSFNLGKIHFACSEHYSQLTESSDGWYIAAPKWEDLGLKYVSVVGDSISTYEGFVPNGYVVFYDEETQYANGLSSVYDTWWAQVNQFLHAYICVNNSYSGSRVSGAGFPAASSEERISYLHTRIYTPDIILVYIGFNDFGNGVRIRGKNPLFEKESPLYFESAYELMLKRIKKNYPASKVICGTLMRTRLKGHEDWVFPESFAGIPFERYNEAIRNACRESGCCLAELSKLNVLYETLDGTHPTKLGHREIADTWKACI